MQTNQLRLTGEPAALGLNSATRAELQGMLDAFLQAWHQTFQDGDVVSWNSWSSLLKPVEQYLGKSDVQTPPATKYLLLHLLECVLRPFRSYKHTYRHSFWTNPVYLAVVVTSLGVGGLSYHFASAFWVVWFVLALWAGARLVSFFRMLRITRAGEAVQHQIESNEYVEENVIRGICDMERRGVFVPTLLYSLLARLPLKPPGR